jgi:succinylglutamate desuccinylase
MSNDGTGLVEAPERLERIAGDLRGARSGPTLIVMAGIHGNEPAGLRATKRVLARLDEVRPLRCGQFAALVGNLSASRFDTRFIDLDLNRQWIPSRLARLRATEIGDDAAIEDGEQLELLDVLCDIVSRAEGDIYFIDLHTCSAEGPPFLTVGDTLRNRSFARQFPLPLILGLEEQVDGALLEYVNNFGVVTMGVEGGQHRSQRAVECLEALIWLALLAIGLVDEPTVPDVQQLRQTLIDASRGTPRVVEVRRRHAISSDMKFRMEPGYRNLQAIRAGALLARDKDGSIYAREDGLLLLPLYQGKGDDGFFVAREVKRQWLRVSAVLRRMRLNRLLPLLPGVRRHPTRREVLIVNTRVARLYPLDFFHLFGFRKLRASGNALLVSRRRYDLTPPKKVSFDEP